MAVVAESTCPNCSKKTYELHNTPVNNIVRYTVACSACGYLGYIGSSSKIASAEFVSAYKSKAQPVTGYNGPLSPTLPQMIGKYSGDTEAQILSRRCPELYSKTTPCGGRVDLVSAKSANVTHFYIKCSICLATLSHGASKQKAINAYDKLTYKSTQINSSTNLVPNTPIKYPTHTPAGFPIRKNIASSSTLNTSSRCPTCANKLTYTYPNKSSKLNRFMITCPKCGLLYTANTTIEIAEYFVSLYKEDKQTKEQNASKFTMEEAYEANKTAVHCVACSKRTIQKALSFYFIGYCECVEKLPKIL